MKILSVSTFKKKYQKTIVAVVELDTGEKLYHEPETVVLFDLHAQDELDEKTFQALKNTDDAYKCRAYALNLLAIRPRSISELKNRLVRKEFSTQSIDQCLSELSEKGYLNDADFAHRYVRARLKQKALGESMMRMELRKKGLSNDLIEKSIQSVYGDETALTMALDVARKKMATYKKLEPQKVRQKLFFFLSQRGFSQNVIREVFKKLRFGEDEGDG
ncbi:regulatory protein RecX [bacterium]|nr:regulatory protein RecX [bacterium]